MYKLQTNYNGGMPFELNDIRWDQDSVRDVLKGILDSFKYTDSGGFKLNGCIVTDIEGGYQCSAGYVYFSGEVFKVDAHTVSFGSEGCHYVFGVVTTYDIAGNDVFKDGSAHSTYEIRKAVLIVNTDVSFIASNFLQYNGLSIKEIIYDFTSEKETAWINIADFQSNFANSSIAPGSTCDYKKDSFNTVWLRGMATSDASSAGCNIFQLPVGYRPLNTIYLTGAVLGRDFDISILPTGWVILNNAVDNAGIVSVNLNNIQFKIN